MICLEYFQVRYIHNGRTRYVLTGPPERPKKLVVVRISSGSLRHSTLTCIPGTRTFTCLFGHVCERSGPVHGHVVLNDGQHVSSNDLTRPYLQDPHAGSHCTPT